MHRAISVDDNKRVGDNARNLAADISWSSLPIEAVRCGRRHWPIFAPMSAMVANNGASLYAMASKTDMMAVLIYSTGPRSAAVDAPWRATKASDIIIMQRGRPACARVDSAVTISSRSDNINTAGA